MVDTSKIDVSLSRSAEAPLRCLPVPLHAYCGPKLNIRVAPLNAGETLPGPFPPPFFSTDKVAAVTDECAAIATRLSRLVPNMRWELFISQARGWAISVPAAPAVYQHRPSICSDAERRVKVCSAVFCLLPEAQVLLPCSRQPFSERERSQTFSIKTRSCSNTCTVSCNTA